MFVPTHITTTGLLLQVDPSDMNPRTGGVMGKLPDGSQALRDWREVWSLDTPNAEEILERMGLRLERAAQEDDSNRSTLARWAVAVNESRQALANGVEQVLNNRDTGLNTRRMLEDAMVIAMGQLAKFRP